MKVDYSLVTTIKLDLVNVFAVIGEQVLLVDAGGPGSAEKIISELNNNGIAEEQVGLILITHGHDDHYGSANELRKLTGAKIAVHRLDSANLQSGANGDLIPVGTKGKLVQKVARKQEVSSSIRVEPDIFLDGDLNLEYMGIPGLIMHTPGHTPGSVSVVLDNGEAILADLLFGGMIWTGRPGYPFFASDLMQLRSSIIAVLSHSPEIVYVSHGGPFTLKMVQQFLRLTEVR